MRWIVLLSLLLPGMLCAQLATNQLGSATSVATDDGAVIHCLVNLPALVVLSGKNPKRERIALEAKQLKSPEIHVFEAAGHALFVDEAEKFNSLLEGFVERNEQAKRP